VGPRPLTSTKRYSDSLVEQAVQGRDEHAIKFVEACQSEFQLTADPVFFAAARDATARLS
jgi:hypothetical protein